MQVYYVKIGEKILVCKHDKSIIKLLGLDKNSFWSWIRIIELIKIWVSPGSSSPIYSVTGCTIPITWDLFIPIQQHRVNVS